MAAICRHQSRGRGVQRESSGVCRDPSELPPECWAAHAQKDSAEPGRELLLAGWVCIRAQTPHWALLRQDWDKTAATEVRPGCWGKAQHGNALGLELQIPKPTLTQTKFRAQRLEQIICPPEQDPLLFFQILTQGYACWFLKRGKWVREREGGREKHGYVRKYQLVASYMCSNWGSNWQYLVYGSMLQPNEPHVPGPTTLWGKIMQSRFITMDHPQCPAHNTNY